eukprot:382150-Amphidinium_carterae.1
MLRVEQQLPALRGIGRLTCKGSHHFAPGCSWRQGEGFRVTLYIYNGSLYTSTTGNAIHLPWVIRCIYFGSLYTSTCVALYIDLHGSHLP